MKKNSRWKRIRNENKEGTKDWKESWWRPRGKGNVKWGKERGNEKEERRQKGRKERRQKGGKKAGRSKGRSPVNVLRSGCESFLRPFFFKFSCVYSFIFSVDVFRSTNELTGHSSFSFLSFFPFLFAFSFPFLFFFSFFSLFLFNSESLKGRSNKGKFKCKKRGSRF